MNQTLFALIAVLSFGKTYSQVNSIQFSCVSQIDSVAEKNFYDNFLETDDCVLSIKRLIVSRIEKNSMLSKKIFIDSTDLTLIGIFRPKFENCSNTILILLSGFHSYLLTLDPELRIIDSEVLGENTPVLWNAKNGKGRCQRTKSYFDNCRSIKSITTILEINNRNKEKVVSKETRNFVINSNGEIDRQ